MKNEHKVVGEVVEMSVQEKQVKFDLSDFQAVDRYGSWKLSRGASVYADFRHEEKMCKITLHKLLTGSKWVRWVNGDRFDFRRANLEPIAKQIRAKAYGGFPFTPNEHRVEDGIVLIRVKSKNEDTETYVDEEDYPLVSGYRWVLNPVNGYVQTCKRVGKMNKHYYMHRLIVGAEKHEEKVDHINGNKLDNRLDNLRFCNQSANGHNSYKHRDGIVGVSETGNKCGSFAAQIQIDGVRHRKTFKTFDEAVEQYREWEREFNPSGLS